MGKLKKFFAMFARTHRETPPAPPLATTQGNTALDETIIFLSERRRKAVEEELKEEALRNLRIWELLIFDPFSPFPSEVGISVKNREVPPPPELLETITDVGILVRLMGVPGGHRHYTLFKERLVAVLSQFPYGSVYLLRTGSLENIRCVTQEGEIYYRVFGWRGQDLPADGAYPSKPSASGWVQLSGINAGQLAQWCPPEVYHAFQTVQVTKRGSTLITPWLLRTFYSQHPQHPYTRFLWQIAAGNAGKSSFELPVETFTDDDGPLARRLNALQALLDARLDIIPGYIPGDAWWVDCSIGQTLREKPKLVNCPLEKPAALMAVVYSEYRDPGARGWWDSETVLKRDGVTILFNRTEISRSKNPWQQSCVVALVQVGATLVLNHDIGLFYHPKNGRVTLMQWNVSLTEEANPALSMNATPCLVAELGALRAQLERAKNLAKEENTLFGQSRPETIADIERIGYELRNRQAAMDTADPLKTNSHQTKTK